MTRQGCLLLAAALTVFAAQPATAEGATAALTNQELQSLIRAMSRSPRAGGRTQTPFCRTVLCPAATHGLWDSTSKTPRGIQRLRYTRGSLGRGQL